MLEGQTYSNKVKVCVARGSHSALIHQAGPRRPQLNFVTQLFLCRLKTHSSIPLHPPLDYVWLLFSSLLFSLFSLWALKYHRNKCAPISLIKSICRGASRCIQSPLLQLTQVDALRLTLIMLICRTVPAGPTDRRVATGVRCQVMTKRVTEDPSAVAECKRIWRGDKLLKCPHLQDQVMRYSQTGFVN